MRPQARMARMLTAAHQQMAFQCPIQPATVNQVRSPHCHGAAGFRHPSPMRMILMVPQAWMLLMGLRSWRQRRQLLLHLRCLRGPAHPLPGRSLSHSRAARIRGSQGQARRRPPIQQLTHHRQMWASLARSDFGLREVASCLRKWKAIRFITMNRMGIVWPSAAKLTMVAAASRGRRGPGRKQAVEDH